jgi:hypothetical protein
MRLVWGALWFVIVLLCAGLIKLLSDNILYAAIMRYLGTYGIAEGDLIAVVTTNLVPIIATIAVVAVIYWMSLQSHAAKSAALPAAAVDATRSQAGVIRRSWNSGGPLPIIAVSLAVAFAVGIVWQINYGPLTNLRKPVSSPLQIVLFPGEIQAARPVLKQILYSLSWINQGTDKWRELLENWQYQIQTNGPDDFMKSANDVYNTIAISGFLGLSNAVSGMDIKKYPDIADIVKNDSPDCIGKPLAFSNELKRIKEHKGADMTFTLINNTKMADWRAALPECSKWITARLGAFAKVEAKYNQGAP